MATIDRLTQPLVSHLAEEKGFGTTSLTKSRPKQPSKALFTIMTNRPSSAFPSTQCYACPPWVFSQPRFARLFIFSRNRSYRWLHYFLPEWFLSRQNRFVGR